MFTCNQDYIIKCSDIPILTHQEDGRFEFKDCYFLEFCVKSDDESTEKIKTICKPFDFRTGVQNLLFKHNKDVLRLFILAGPDVIKNGFEKADDFLALALCKDENQRTKILYFEVNSKFRHSYEPNQKYRRVGTSVVNALKKIYQTREMYGESALYALKIWFKNGFTRIDELKQHIHWYQR